MTEDYQFTNSWFDLTAKPIWDQLIPKVRPKRILEIGSYEGASACYLIHTLAPQQDIELYCVDSWAGGVEHQAGEAAAADMEAVEQRFHHNTQLAIQNAHYTVTLVPRKGFSDVCLNQLLHEGKRGYFDFIYVDGSHQAPDVLCDAVLGFKLLKVGGYMVFDDYLWNENLPYGKDPIRSPKIAVDAFVNVNIRKLNILQTPLYQFYIQKIAE
ncbi:MAG: class I SAM-dependent methyltransferase [Hyphomicrobiales bacterium]|nr:class I SAM-dependent methyltransferase [Rickettsiales bacterium]MCP5361447.1 class I SAM-dependent methyltransferase [Hyphomicrobiales bacterium]